MKLLGTIMFGCFIGYATGWLGVVVVACFVLKHAYDRWRIEQTVRSILTPNMIEQLEKYKQLEKYDKKYK